VRFLGHHHQRRGPHDPLTAAEARTLVETVLLEDDEPARHFAGTADGAACGHFKTAIRSEITPP
jgi:hypothetical protein